VKESIRVYTHLSRLIAGGPKSELAFWPKKFRCGADLCSSVLATGRRLSKRFIWLLQIIFQIEIGLIELDFEQLKG